LAVLALTAWQAAFGQVSRSKASKGPRALGLLQVMPNGKARLIPVVILIDGQYYDASAYKASPVPMALWSETVYEGFRTGISQGIFTVAGALQNQKTNEWIAEGTWQTAESLAVKSNKKPSPTVPRGFEDDSAPPVLRHSGASKPKPPETAPTPQSTAQAPAPTQPTSTSSTPPAPAPTTSAPSSGSSSSASSTSVATPEQKEEEDPNRPTLKRGKPAAAAPEPAVSPIPPATKPSAHAPAAAAPSKTAQPQLIPAISDADGPEPHSYIYDLKPEEEVSLRNKMLALSADEVRARAKQLASELVGSPEPARSSKARATTRAKPEQPNFDDVQFRVFDLSSSNEPTMVLTASARLPERTTQAGSADLQYFVTLVARQDINGDVHKAFSNVTDTQHLDVVPKFELIDAVDVDGDGRAELLFRKMYDASSAFVVYRVIGDQLYPLFEGVPG
jgi:hypothetical protein